MSDNDETFEFGLVDPNSIKVTRLLSNGKLRLREAKDLTGLKASLQAFGQIEPIVIERDGELIAGFRRLTAAKELGWKSIRVVFRDKMDDLTARSLELEENIQRLDMSWVERTMALAELHKIKQIQNPGWGQTQTAIAADTQQSHVAEAIAMAKMIELFPELKEAKSFHQATSWAKQRAELATRTIEVRDAAPENASVEERILLGDSVELIKSLPDESINLVLTDPPFGIGYDSLKAGKSSTLSTYKDGEEEYFHILGIIPDLYRVLKPNGWLVWFLGPRWLTTCMVNFQDIGFTMDEIPVIWDRSQGRTFTMRPDHYFNRAYDMALHGFKGDPQMVQRSKNNILQFAPVDVNDRELTVERPVELYAELIKRMTVEGEVVADFFVGSGSVLAAAAMLKRKYIGCEMNPERRAVAIKKVLAYTPKE